MCIFSSPLFYRSEVGRFSARSQLATPLQTDRHTDIQTESVRKNRRVRRKIALSKRFLVRSVGHVLPLLSLSLSHSHTHRHTRGRWNKEPDLVGWGEPSEGWLRRRGRSSEQARRGEDGGSTAPSYWLTSKRESEKEGRKKKGSGEKLLGKYNRKERFTPY